ncbi:MAG: phosphate/phosphite/phosphonate ABC transporter substrate-binding protein [Campylobacterota bacterium]|nr:phosphate/phosphite/phosphonate ABC transporter substrate-binding protein [Campylobacterota bacterium]
MKKIFIVMTLFMSINLLAKEQCLRYGIIPYASTVKIEKSYQKWKSFLENKTDRCIDIHIKSSYNDIIKMFANDQLDFAFVGPFSYILTKQHTDVEPIVTGITSDGHATYKSLLTVTKDVAKELNINTPLKGEKGMAVLKQKLQAYKKKWSIAFTDESSTSGYAVPSYYMKKVQLDPKEYFKKNAFVGTHDVAQLVVAHDIIPLAFSAQMFYNQMLRNNKITKDQNVIIWESDDIPKSPIIVKSDLSNNIKLKLQKALINLPKDHFPELGKTIGYKETNKENYMIIKNIHNYLKR